MNRIASQNRHPWSLIAIALAAALPLLGLELVAGRALARHHAREREALAALPEAGARVVRELVGARAEQLCARLEQTTLVQWCDRVRDENPDTPRLVPTPLTEALPGEPVLAWFGVDAMARSIGLASGPSPTFLLTPGPRPADPVEPAIRAEIEAWLADFDRPLAARVARFAGPVRVVEEPLEALLDFLIENERRTKYLEQTRTAAEALRAQAHQDRVEFALSAVELRPAAVDGERLLLAVRQAAPTAPGLRLLGEQSRSLAADLQRELPERLTLLQGVVLDRRAAVEGWVDEARRAVPAGVELWLGRKAPGDELSSASVDIDRALGLPTHAGPQTVLWAVVDPRPLRSDQRLEWWAVHAALLLVALAGGWWLATTLRRLQRRLRRAERIGNFVAAVTHEFRTPLSTIALHAEMLLDGWTQDPEQRHEYHRRIAAETNRLSRLVERILEQSQLTRGRAQAPTSEWRLEDLSRMVEELRPSVEAGAPAGPLDVAFELARDLPPVRLTHEAVDSIVTNLVENARKYAPVGPGGEPIQIRTGRDPEGVWLEVLDRGPGIPEAERRRVFEAFYRVGNEATRTSTGTGLGLHLVELQAKALGGRVAALERAGGGCRVRVVLPVPE